MRVALVVFAAAAVIGLTLPNMWLVKSGVFLPIVVDSSYHVLSVVPNSPVSDAGFKAGDRIDAASLSLLGKLSLSGDYLLRPNQSFGATVVRAGGTHDLIVRGRAGTRSTLAILKRISASLFVIVALALVIRHPSMRLLGFFLYAIGSVNGSPLVLSDHPVIYAIVSCLLFSFVYPVLGPIGLLVFASRFPQEHPTARWRQALVRAIPAIALILAASVVFLYPAYLAGRPVPPAFTVAASMLGNAVVTLGMIALVAGFGGAPAPERQRLRWVVCGFAIFYASLIYERMAALFPAMWPNGWTQAGWPVDVLNSFQLFIPLAVAYAVQRHHVLGLSFVVARGLVFGILTSLGIALFAAIEWFIGNSLAQHGIGSAIDLCAAIAIGFGIHSINKHVTAVVDAVVFRQKHRGVQRLAKCAAGLAHVTSLSHIERILVEEPFDALSLTCACMARADDDGRLAATYRAGLPHGARLELEDTELATRIGQCSRGLVLDKTFWDSRLTPNAVHPAVAFPIRVRAAVWGIVFYGNHRTGEALDPDERRVLESLCTAAAAAVDHVEAIDLRRRLEDAERRAQGLEQRLQGLQVSG